MSLTVLKALSGYIQALSGPIRSVWQRLRRSGRAVSAIGSVAAWLLAMPLAAMAATDGKAPDMTYHSKPRLGILVPIGPPDYSELMTHFVKEKTLKYGPFTYFVGTLKKVPTVICIQPFGGPVTRAMSAQAMLTHFNIKALIYPGTSGAHLEADQMAIGDVVLGAKHVNFANFFMTKAGDLIPDEFTAESAMGRFNMLYANPTLLHYLACSATQVASAAKMPDWVNPGLTQAHPKIFYYGIQGTSTMWLANKAFIQKTHKAFHELDEDGDWFSAVVAAMYDVPFIEVSTISDSIFEFPDTERGIPEPPKSADPAVHVKNASVLAQDMSNRIAVALIGRYGEKILKGHFPTPEASPVPDDWYADAANPRDLLKGKDCQP